jgi:tRNA dimethylallyltransferase
VRRNTVVIICGPTAVGKTALALQLARQLDTDIISADSRQCYIELNIGVAKPNAAELAAVHHYFINTHSIHEEVNAGIFEELALAATSEIFKNHRVAVVVGGTGLYIKAFAEGIDDMPAVDPSIRRQVIESYKENGLAFLQNEVAEKDPAFWSIAERDNPQRLMRALEVWLACGRSITSFRKGKKEARPFDIIKVGLELPRQQLYDQVNLRVDLMIQNGLVEEVKGLRPYKDLNALQTVGYRELFDFLDGNASLSEAVENVKRNTRHYAKRQMTWFKRDEQITWFNPGSKEIFEFICESSRF